MQKFLRLIARLIVARHECTYVRHCKENAPIYMYYVAPETPMISSVIADCLDLAPPPIFWTITIHSAYMYVLSSTHIIFDTDASLNRRINLSRKMAPNSATVCTRHVPVPVLVQ